MKVLVTGATGFIGAALTRRLMSQPRFDLRVVARKPDGGLPARIERVVLTDLNDATDWNTALKDVNVAVHLAARVHLGNETKANPIEEYRRLNVAGTLNLARQAVAAGVSRLVFLSSVRVNGEDGYYTETSEPAPADFYAISKFEAETGLREISSHSGLHVTIVRPPLVYGPGVKANFLALVRAVASGVPLPFGAIRNRRSLVALDNLIDLIVTCLEHPAAANQTFLVSDGEDLSTPDLIRRLARAMGRPARLFPVPEVVLTASAAVLGRREMARRLLGSLQVDISKAREVLGWVPPISVDEGLRRAVLTH